MGDKLIGWTTPFHFPHVLDQDRFHEDSVTLGYGGGAGALVGGSDSNLTLQPLALEGSKGLGVAAGASYLTPEHEPRD